MKRFIEIVTAVSLATSMLVANNAIAAAAAASDSARIASKYASWAGGRANSDALVNGLRTGAPVTIVTVGPDKSKSMAGFTAQTSMSTEEVASALAGAKQTLDRMGIRRPDAEQIQAALIGGEITPPKGKSQLVQGTVALRMAPIPVGTVAAR
jgi:hypothetical protein